MSFKFKGNFNEVRASLKRKNGIIRARLTQGMLFGIRLFEAKIVKEQMSGRKSPGFGLNVITGTLRRSWIVTQMDIITDFIVTLGTTTIYARTHQFGDIKRNIPKRLHVLEDFKVSGSSLIRESMLDRLKKSL